MFRDNLDIALTELRANRLRTLLTMLGIVIGIASVIAIMTVGNSMNKAVSASMNEMGAGNMSFYVTQKERNPETQVREMKSRDMVNEDMLEDLEDRYRGRIKGVALSKSVGEGKIGQRKHELTVTINGINGVALESKNLNMVAGRQFRARDYANRSKVVIISSKLAKDLYGKNYENAIGKSLECQIKDRFFGYSVVGVYEHQASKDDFMMGSGSTECYIPLRTALTQLNQDFLFTDFDVVSIPGEDPESMLSEIKNYMNDKYYKENDTYHVDGYSMSSWVKESERMTKSLTLALSAIAAISLLVGGIGVMNIMVVSITERTKEIGIRKALGATNQAIRLQFITESIVMCLAGGLIGVVLGIAAGLGISKMMSYPGTIPVFWIFVSVAFSVAFGVFFGLYPANKAAKMDPIEALRYE